MKDYFTGKETKETDITDNLMFGLNQLVYFGGLAVGIGGIRKLYGAANQNTQDYVKSVINENKNKIEINPINFFEKIALANKQSEISKSMSMSYEDTLLTNGIDKDLIQIKKQIEYEIETNMSQLSDTEKQSIKDKLYESKSKEYMTLKNLSTETAKTYLSASGIKYVDNTDPDRFATDIYTQGEYTNKNNLSPYQRKIIRSLKESGLFVTQESAEGKNIIGGIEIRKKANNSVDIILEEPNGKIHIVNLPKGFYSHDLLGTISGNIENNNSSIKVPTGKVVNPFFTMDSQTKALGLDIVTNNANTYFIDTATAFEFHVKKLIKAGSNASEIIKGINSFKQKMAVTAAPTPLAPPTLTIGVKNFNEFVNDSTTVGAASQTADSVRKVWDFLGKNPDKPILDLGAFKRFKEYLKVISKKENHNLKDAATKFLTDVERSNKSGEWDDINKSMQEFDILITNKNKKAEYKTLIDTYNNWYKKLIQRRGGGGYHDTVSLGNPYIVVKNIAFDKGSSSNTATYGLTHNHQIKDKNRQNIYESLNAPTASGITAMHKNTEGKLEKLAPRVNMVLMSGEVSKSVGLGQDGGFIVEPESGSSFLKSITTKDNSKIELTRDPLNKKNISITITNAIKNETIVLVDNEARTFWKNFIKQNKARKRDGIIKSKLKVGTQEATLLKHFDTIKEEKNRRIYENGQLGFEQKVETITVAKDDVTGSKSNLSLSTNKNALESPLKEFIPQSDLYTVFKSMDDELSKKNKNIVEFDIYQDMVNKTFNKLIENKKKLLNTTELTDRQINRIKHKVNYRTLASFYGNKSNLEFDTIRNLQKAGKLYKRENRAILKPLIVGLKNARQHIKDLEIQLQTKKDNYNRYFIEVVTNKISKAEYGKFDLGMGNLSDSLSKTSMFYSQDNMFETKPDGSLKIKYNPSDSFILRDNHMSVLFGIKEDNQYKSFTMFEPKILEALEDRRKSTEIISLEMVKGHRFQDNKPVLGSTFSINIQSTLPVSDFILGDQFKKVNLNSRELMFLKLSNPYYYDLISYQMEQRNTWLVNHMKYLKSNMEIYDSRREFADNEIIKVNKKPIEEYRRSAKKNMFLYNDLIQAENIVKKTAEQTGQEFFNLKQIIRQTIKTSKQMSTLNTGDTEYSKIENIHKNLLTKLGSNSTYGINEIFEVQARELKDIINSTTNLKPGETSILDLEEFFGYKKDALGTNGKIAIQGIDPKELTESISHKVNINGTVSNTVRIDPKSSTSILTKLFSAREAIKYIKDIQKKSKNNKDPIFTKMISSIENTIFGENGLLAEHRNYIQSESVTDGSLLQRKGHEFSLEGMSSTIKSNYLSNTPNAIVMNEETFIRSALGDKVFKEAEDLLKYKKIKSQRSRIEKFINSEQHNKLKTALNDPKEAQTYENQLNEKIKRAKASKKDPSEITKIINDINKQKRIFKYYKKNKDIIDYFNNELWEVTKAKNAESLEIYKSAKDLAKQIREGKKYFVNTLRHPTMSELNMADFYVKLDERATTGDLLLSQVDISLRAQADQDKDRIMLISKGLRNILANQLNIPSYEKALQEVTSDIYGLRNSLFKISNTTDNPGQFNLKALNYTSEKQMDYILNKEKVAKSLIFDDLDNVIEKIINFGSERFNLSKTDKLKLKEHIKNNRNNLLNGIDGKVFYLEGITTQDNQKPEIMKSGIKEGFEKIKTPGAAGLELKSYDVKALKFQSEYGLDKLTSNKRILATNLKEKYYSNWKKLVDNIDSETTDLVSKYTNSLSTGVRLQKLDAPTLYSTNTMMSLALSFVKKGVQYTDHHRDVFENINTFLRDFTTAYGEVPLQSKHGTPSIVEGLKSILDVIRKGKGGKHSEQAALRLSNLDFNVHLNPEELLFFNKTKDSTKIKYKAYKEGIQVQSNMFAETFNKVAGSNVISFENGNIKINGNLNNAILKINDNSVKNSTSFVSYEAYLKSVAESIQDVNAQQNLVSHLSTYSSNRKGNLGEALFAGIIQSQKKLEGMSKFESSVEMSPELAKHFGRTVGSLNEHASTQKFMEGVEKGYNFLKGQHLSGPTASELKLKDIYTNLKNNEFRLGFAFASNLSMEQIEQFNQLKGKGRSTLVRTISVPEAQNINFAESVHATNAVSNFKGIGKSALVGTLIGMGINQIISGFSIPDLKGDRGLGGEYWEKKATKNSENMLKPRPPMVERVSPATRDKAIDIYKLRQHQSTVNNFYKDRSLIEKNNVHQETLGIRIR